MSHCAPEATLHVKPPRHAHGLEGCFERMARWQQRFCRQMCCVRGTAHDLSVDERSRRLGPSETKIMYVVSRQPSMEVPGRTKTSKRNMPA